MTKILVINGPNLNNLGRRDTGIYGTRTLKEIEQSIAESASRLGVDVAFFQSNHEGAIVDHLQEEAPSADGIIINPAALTGVGYSLGDALRDAGLPLIEVHLSNIHARERFRQRSLIAPIALGQISGLGWHGYLLALEHLAMTLGEPGQGRPAALGGPPDDVDGHASHCHDKPPHPAADSPAG